MRPIFSASDNCRDEAGDALMKCRLITEERIPAPDFMHRTCIRESLAYAWIPLSEFSRRLVLCIDDLGSYLRRTMRRTCGPDAYSRNNLISPPFLSNYLPNSSSSSFPRSPFYYSFCVLAVLGDLEKLMAF